MQLPPRLRPTEAATILEPLTIAAKKLAKKKATTRRVAPSKVKSENLILTLIDVRMPQEITTGTIPGARQIPLDNILQTVPSEIPDPTAPVVVYCKSGMRGGMAQGALRKLGYTNVSNIVGGFDAWQKAGLPVLQ
ncbi:MAG: rhodanese-like domain-containing protein [Planctomycetes bacterium]|jgi:rhodanese-related sulfurtransferase|nr:rhodanese-like domain-containing protein [Planctomycetota bacterium]CAG0953002.1 thiosulfate sulfurtransferase [Planctomycetaceae bacterium]